MTYPTEHEIENAHIDQHGQLARSCETCALITELAEVKRERDEAVRLLIAANNAGALDCWDPQTDMVDIGGHLDERDCGVCPICDLRNYLDLLATIDKEPPK